MLDRSWLEALHLSAPEVAALVMEDADEELRGWADVHLSECPRCNRLVRAARPGSELTVLVERRLLMSESIAQEDVVGPGLGSGPSSSSFDDEADPPVRRGNKDGSPRTSVPAEKPRRRAQSDPPPDEPGVPSPIAGFADRTLVCKYCSEDFVWTAGEQEFYASRGLVNAPGRCPTCRAARRAANSGYAGGMAGPREFFVATCSNCGGQARVPFQPRGDKPVFCSSCFENVRPAGGGVGGARRGRPYNDDDGLVGSRR